MKPSNQAPTGNLYMAPGGQTYANANAYANSESFQKTPLGGVNTDYAPGYRSEDYYRNQSTGFTPSVSTTTISNENKMNAVPKIVNSFNNLSNKGITTDVNGTAHYPDGSIYDPSGSSDTEEDDGYSSLLESMKSNLDASTKAQIDNIQQKMNLRKEEQKRATDSALKGTTNALLMGGATGQGSSAQFAPISSGGIIQSQEAYGIRKIAELDSIENDEIAAAKASQQQGNFQIMEKQLARIEKIRSEKIEAAKELNKQILERNKEEAKRNEASQRESAIAGIYEQGITDVPQAMAELKKLGVNATTKEVSDTIGLLSGVGGSGIVGEYNYYKSEARRNGQVPMSFNDYQNLDANRKRSIAAARISGGTGAYSKDQEKAIDQINTSVTNNATYKKYNAMKASAENIEVALGQGSGLGDIAAINQFQKVIDEGAVTRDQDVQLIQGAQSLADTYKTKINKLKMGGQLSDEQRKEMLDLTTKMIDAQKKAVDKDPGISAQKKKADRFGVDVSETIIGETSGSNDVANGVIEQGKQAKTAIDSYVRSNPKDPNIKIISNFYSAGKDDIAILEWMKLRKLIK